MPIPLDIILVCILTVIIHFVAIISLSARIVGVRTKKISSSTSIFNIISLIAQFSNTIQAPLLTKYVEKGITLAQHNDFIFREIIFCATLGTCIGAFAVPTVHRFMKKGVEALYVHRSIFVLLTKSIRKSTFIVLKKSLTLPKIENVYRLKYYDDIPKKMILLNCLVYGFITVSVLSCLYAGYLNPNLRTTSLSMNGFSSGLATIGMLLFIEPYNATLTDKVVDGSVSESYFRRYLTFVIIARVFGTFLGQFLLIPLAKVIAVLVQWL
ncbi:lipid II flippase family protein [Runella sp. SP2]|uniref:lipid II flippase family protein n=1 Tax=Runella sp. SP2 TaxID=2268026 RepID=UPI000F08E72D|nr:DUF2837 family protein [Runella sp. SP2]AYQ31335.1 DUF2837 family protein [Runella sp. SP2]